jgi:hypothetical protein
VRLATKRRVLAGFLLVSLAWPAAHFGLVHAFGVSPWSWWGWAMYTQPQPRVQALAFSTADGRALDLRRATPERALAVRAAYETFSLDRLAYGTLREPDDFARALLRAFPDEVGVRIEVRRIVLDRASGIVEPRGEWTYTYTRADLAGRGGSW